MCGKIRVMKTLHDQFTKDKFPQIQTECGRCGIQFERAGDSFVNDGFAGLVCKACDNILTMRKKGELKNQQHNVYD